MRALLAVSSILTVAAAAPAAVMAQEPAAVTLTVTTEETERVHAAGSAGHHVVFTITNTGRDTATYDLACVGLGRVRCAGVKHPQVTVPARDSVEVVVFYEVGEPGRGLLTLLARSPSRAARAETQLPIEVRP